MLSETLAVLSSHRSPQLLSEFFSPSLQNHLLLATVPKMGTDDHATATEFVFQVHLLKDGMSGFLWVPILRRRKYVWASSHPHLINN